MPIAHYLNRRRSSWTVAPVCTLHSALRSVLVFACSPGILTVLLQGALGLSQEAQSSSSRPRLSAHSLLLACFVNRGAGAALAIHPTQTIQGNGHSHCRKKVSSPRTEFGRSSTPPQTNRPRRHTGRSCLSALPLHRSARLSHVELNLHSCASGRKRAEAERHFQALRKADDLTCFSRCCIAPSASAAMYSAQTANGLGVTDGSGTINPAALNSGMSQSQSQILFPGAISIPQL